MVLHPSSLQYSKTLGYPLSKYWLSQSSVVNWLFMLVSQAPRYPDFLLSLEFWCYVGHLHLPISVGVVVVVVGTRVAVAAWRRRWISFLEDSIPTTLTWRRYRWLYLYSHFSSDGSDVDAHFWSYVASHFWSSAYAAHGSDVAVDVAPFLGYYFVASLRVCCFFC